MAEVVKLENEIKNLEKKFGEENKFNFELVVKSVYKQVDDGGEEKWYVEGFVATTDKDTDNDIITVEALEQAVGILKTKYTTVLYNHNFDRPIGKIVDAAVKDTDWGSKGLWIKFLISKTEPEIWQKVQEGVLCKFSIGAFAIREPVYKETGEGQPEVDYWKIVELYPYEVSLVSVPANPNAVALDYYVSKFFKAENNFNKGVKDMSKVEKGEGKSKPKIKINKQKVDFRPWSKVNKIKLAQILEESGNKTAIKEAFGVVPDYEKRSTWKFPHHVLVNVGDNEYELRLSYTGLMAAYKAFRGARRKPKLTEEQKKSLKSHLKKHFQQLVDMDIYDEIPEALKSIMPIIARELNGEELDSSEKDLLEKEFLSKDIDLIDEIEKEIENEEKEENNIEKEVNEDSKDNVEKDKKVEKEDINKQVEMEENEFFDKLRDIIREVVEDVLDEYFDSDDEEDGDKNNEKMLKIDTNDKNLEKSVGKEDKMSEKKEIEKEIKEEEKVEKNVEEKVEENEKNEVIETLKKEIEALKKELEALKQEPVVKGVDNQRKEENEGFDLAKFIRSEEFEKAPIEKKLEVLKLLMENK